MGRLVNPNEFVAENVEKYIERSTSKYSTLLETTPVFLTYFHQNRAYTTNDLGLENVEDDLGRDSPIKYEKMNKLPAYGADTITLNFERGDMGLNTNYEGELTLLPNLIKPYPNDYFYFDDIGENYLFKVTEIQEDLIKSKPFYKISYRFSKYQNEELESQIVEDYTVEFNNIGTDNVSVIKTSTYQIIDAVNKVTDKLREFYIRNFYDETNNVFTLNVYTLGIDIYSQFLNKFLIDNDVLALSSSRKEFYNSIKLLEYIPTEPEFDAVYAKTIYGAVSYQDVREFFGRFFTYMDVTYPHVPWFRVNKDYKAMIMLFIDQPEKSDKILELIDKEFYGRIKLNNQYLNERDYFMENLIIRYINKDNTLPDMDLIKQINNNIWRKDMRAYLFIPLIIFILRSLVRYDQIKQN